MFDIKLMSYLSNPVIVRILLISRSQKPFSRHNISTNFHVHPFISGILNQNNVYEGENYSGNRTEFQLFNYDF